MMLVGIASIFCFGFFCRQPAINKKSAMKEGFVLVELFTSEGCSSCPAADELVAKIAGEKANNVYILAYHVDYWDRLGWKDSFSQAAFSNRQRQYARHLSLQGVYTPQIVVNGKQDFVGSNEPKLRNALENRVANSSSLSFDAVRTADNKIRINYAFTEVKHGLLNIALVQRDAVTMVKGGENKGRNLHHVNIVKELKTIDGNKGSFTMDIPDDMKKLPLELVAFTQQQNDYSITSAVKVDL